MNNRLLITALQDTCLKREPSQSSSLSSDQKKKVKKDCIYQVEGYKKEGRHWKVILSYEAGIWYIWADHWYVSWETLIEEETEKKEESKPEPKPVPPVIVVPEKKYSPAVQRQIDRLKAYTGKVDLDTRTTYFSQRDNKYKNRKQAPWRTCNSSSNAMYLRWLQDATGTRPILLNDDPYIDKVFRFGDTIYHHNQTKALNTYGFKTKWNGDSDYKFILELLEAGFPVVINILHKGGLNNPSGGHIIVLCGYKNGVFIVKDPWGDLMSGYRNHNGNNVSIPEVQIKRRWQGWYRMLA